MVVRPEFTVPAFEVFYQSTAFLFSVTSHCVLTTWLLIVFSILENEDFIGRELHRTLFETTFHAVGFCLYTAASVWSLVVTRRELHPVDDDDQGNSLRDKLLTAAILGILAGCGHLAQPDRLAAAPRQKLARRLVL